MMMMMMMTEATAELASHIERITQIEAE